MPEPAPPHVPAAAEPHSADPGAFDWVIVGGGIHGVHLAVCLLGEGGVPRERLAIVDPGAELLGRWRERTAITGMRYLRSPSVHHLAPDPFALRRFAKRREHRAIAAYAAPYDRPSLALFDAHCRDVVAGRRLDELHLRGRVDACAIGDDAVELRLGDGRRLRARNVVLALGADDQREWPAWAPRGDPRVRHVFEPGAGLPDGDGRTVGVVGGGVSAAQVALHVAERGPRVVMFTRHDLREHTFDSDPGWLGPKFMTGFAGTRDLGRRREMIREGRLRGSMPRDVRLALERAVERGDVTLRRGDVAAAEARRDAIRVRTGDGHAVDVDELLLATGYTPRRPGGALVDDLVASHDLPCAPCGYPIVDAALRWHPRVRVTGPLADLELGPTARNIAGARQAGERIVTQLRKAERRAAEAARAQPRSGRANALRARPNAEMPHAPAATANSATSVHDAAAPWRDSPASVISAPSTASPPSTAVPARSSSTTNTCPIRLHMDPSIDRDTAPTEIDLPTGASR